LASSSVVIGRLLTLSEDAENSKTLPAPKSATLNNAIAPQVGALCRVTTDIGAPSTASGQLSNLTRHNCMAQFRTFLIKFVRSCVVSPVRARQLLPNHWAGDADNTGVDFGERHRF